MPAAREKDEPMHVGRARYRHRLRAAIVGLVALVGAGCGETAADDAASDAVGDIAVAADGGGLGSSDGLDDAASDGDGSASLPDDATASDDAGGDAADGDTAAEAADPLLMGVVPFEGSVGGMQTVILTGVTLGEAQAVLFGESPAVEFEALDPWTIRAVTPPRPPGLVDVTVEFGGGVETVLAAGYRYVAQVKVVAVSPTHGPLGGGTVVTVLGAGFLADTAFVFGDRLAVAALVLDSSTAVMQAPPGSHPGRVAVVASNGDGSGTLKKAFDYREPPRIDDVEPTAGSVGTKTTLTLHGAALLAGGAVIQLQGDGATVPAAVVASAGDGSWLKASIAGCAAGLYDLRYSSPLGETILPEAFVCADFGADGVPVGGALVHVAPNALPANAARPIVIAAVGQLAKLNPATATVMVGGKPAQVLSVQHSNVSGVAHASVRVLPTPPPEGTPLPLKVDVTLDSGGSLGKLPLAFTWLAAVPQIFAATPSTIGSAGGQSVTVNWAPGKPLWGAVTGLQIGALPAGQLKLVHHGADGGSLVGKAPPCSPGPTDARVSFNNGKVLHAAGVLACVGGAPKVVALVPDRGAQSGGTLVDVVGTGLDAVEKLELGGHLVPSSDWQLIHPALLRMKTPRGDPGAADLVTGFAPAGSDHTVGVLTKAFTYFDPATGQLGTWGGPIDRALNVTVVGTGIFKGPIEGATVMIGGGIDVSLKGQTDDRGQVTLSSPDLVGPVTVTATKPGFSAASLVAVDSENVTVRLRPTVPPPSGSGGGGGDDPVEKYPNGVVEGVVINPEKMLQLPQGRCTDVTPANGHCAACESDSTCPDSLTCVALTEAAAAYSSWAEGPSDDPTVGPPRYCLASCLAASDCPGGYECRALGGNPGVFDYRCVPRIGTAQVRCQTSTPSMFGGNPPAGPGEIADSAGAFQIEARLGDVAVICVGGYLAAKTGEFVPRALGIQQNVHVESGQTTSGIQIVLDTPLSRRVRVRLDRLPNGAETENHERFLIAALSFGAQGYLPIGDVSTLVRTDVLTLDHQPWTLTGSLGGATYDVYAGMRRVFGGSVPTAIAVAEDIPYNSAERFAYWPPGAAAPTPSVTMSGPVHAIATGGKHVVAVGARGLVAVWSGAGFSVQPSPVVDDLDAVWLTIDGVDGWAGGANGLLLRRHPLSGWQRWPVSLADDVRAIDGRASNDVWALTADRQLQHFDGAGWTTFAGPLPPPPTLPPNAFTNTPSVHDLAVTPEGDLIVCGDGGLLARGALLPSGKLQWQTLPPGGGSALHGLHVDSDDLFWAAGDQGTLLRVQADKISAIATGTLQPLYTLRRIGADLHAVGAVGTWLRVDAGLATHAHGLADFSVDLRGVAATPDGFVAAGQPLLVMGPYMELPYITEPQPGSPPGNVIRWQAKPGVTPTLNMVRVTSYNYDTIWEIFVKGQVTEAILPDLEAIMGSSPLPIGKLRVRLWRIYAPGLDIDHFNNKQLGVYDWVSYAYTFLLTPAVKSLPTDGPPPPEPALPPGMPGLPDFP